ncbi:MAG: hypothetical protein M3358_20415, partial [Actinomycetota bacterium]|nr:hypothetical protein [Actinomycetota bacterium]
VGNISGGMKNFGSTSTNTRIAQYLLFSLPLPADMMPPAKDSYIPQITYSAEDNSNREAGLR